MLKECPLRGVSPYSKVHNVFVALCQIVMLVESFRNKTQCKEIRLCAKVTGGVLVMTSLGSHLATNEVT